MHMTRKMIYRTSCWREKMHFNAFFLLIMSLKILEQSSYPVNSFYDWLFFSRKKKKEKKLDYFTFTNEALDVKYFPCHTK